MSDRTFGGSITIDGEQAFKRQINDINRTLKLLNSELGLTASSFDESTGSMEKNAAKSKILEKQIEEQKKAIKVLTEAMANAEKQVGANALQTQNWQIKLNNAQTTLTGFEKELKGLNSELTKNSIAFEEGNAKLEKNISSYERSIKVLESQMTALTSGFNSQAKSEADLTKAKVILTQQLEAQRQKMQLLNEKLANAKKYWGEGSKEVSEYTIAINKAQAEINKLEKSLDRNNAELMDLSKSFDKAEKEVSEFNTAMGKNIVTGEKFNSLIFGIKSLIAGYSGKKLFDALIGSNADYEQTLTSLEVLIGDMETAKVLMNDIQNFSSISPLAGSDIEKSTKMLLGYGLEAENVMETISRLGDLSQGNAELLDRISLAYGQMLAKGKVTGEELRQMTEAQVPLLQGLSDYLGKSTAEVSSMISDSEVGIEDLNGAIVQMTSEGGRFFEMMSKQSNTFNGLMNTIFDNLSSLARKTGEEAFENLKNELKGILDEVNRVGDSKFAENLGRDIANAVSAIVSFVKTMYEMKDVLLAAGVAFATFKTAVGTINAISDFKKLTTEVIPLLLAKKAATDAVTVSTVASTTATTAATTAQKGLTAALMANPYGIALVGISLAVGALFSLSSALKNAKSDAEELVDETKHMANELELSAKKAENAFSIYEKGAKATEEYKTANQELAEIFPELVLGIDNQGNAILQTNEIIKEKIELLKQERELQQQSLAEGERKLAIERDKEAQQLINRYNKLSDRIERFESIKYLTPGQKSELDILQGMLGDVGEITEKVNKLHDENKKYLVSLFPPINNLTDKQKELMNEFINITVTAENFSEVIQETNLDKLTEDLKNHIGYSEELNETVESSIDNIEELTHKYESLDAAIDDMNDTLDSAQKEIGNLNKILEKLSENQELTAEDIASLIKLYPELTDKIIETENGYRIEISAIEDLKEVRIQAKIDAINAQAEEAKSVYLETQARINNYSEEISAINDLASAKQALANLESKKSSMVTVDDDGGSKAQYYSQQRELRQMAEAEEVINELAEIYSRNEGYNKLISAGNFGTSDSISKAKKEAEKAEKEAAKEAERLAKESEKAREEAIQKEFRDLKFLLDMEEITQEEYYKNIAHLRDTYFEEGSQKWQDYTVEIKKYLDKISDDSIKKELDMITWQHEMSSLTDKEYYEKLEAYRDKYFEEGSAEWRNYTLQIKRYTEQLAESQISDRYKNSENWISDRNFYNDWEEFGDSEIAAWKRVKDYTEEFYKEGLISYADYVAKIKEIDRNLFTTTNNQVSEAYKNAQSWIDERNFYNDWQDFGDSEIEAWKRVKDYTEEFYKEGLLSYADYISKIKEIDRNLFTITNNQASKIVSNFLEKETQRIEVAKKEISKQVDDLRNEWNVEDRRENLNELYNEEALFRNAATLTGQEHYNSIQEEIKKLEREEELYQLEIKNNELLEKLEQELETLRSKEEEMITALIEQEKDLGTDVLYGISNLGDIFQQAINGLEVALRENVGANAVNTTNYFVEDKSSITQNNSVSDNVDMAAVTRQLAYFRG